LGEWLDAGVAAVILVASTDPALVPHLSLAVSKHLKWCRHNGLPAPAGMVDLLSALEDRGGQSGTSVAFEPSLPDARLVGYKEAAAVLGVSVKTVQRRVRAGRLPAVSVGARRLIPVSALDELVDGRAP
jgi:excisionase family DNA binding protein